jgi:iron complex outermembrane recepter protein
VAGFDEVNRQCLPLLFERYRRLASRTAITTLASTHRSARAFGSIYALIQKGLIGSTILICTPTLAPHCAFASEKRAVREFQIAGGQLVDVLEQFGEQSGLQIVYEPSLIRDQESPGASGRLSSIEALARLLASSDLQWRYADPITVVLSAKAHGDRPPSVLKREQMPVPTTDSGEFAELETILTEAKVADLNAILPIESVDSVFGFGKPIFEIPRSISILSEESMDAYSIRTALDVAKTAPGTYTAPIFGINGNVNLRGVTSDTYFRGVKRLENTQLFPTPITAMSRVEVVRGPSSPLYGPGKAGGYTNFVPKSARASTGKYLPRRVGQLEISTGSYDLHALAGELGGPIDFGEENAGYYVYASAEQSDTYYDNVPFEQYIVQSSFDVQLTSHVRTEFGYMFQHWSGTELAGWNRLSQQLIDTGLYSSGELAVDMDIDRDGLISTAEVDSFGPLLRTIPFGTSADQAASLLGANWRIDDGPLVRLDRRATGQSAEDAAQARINLGYLDTIIDFDHGGTLTNKLYYERLDRFKWTRSSAYGQDTHSKVMEAKILYHQPVEMFDARLKANIGLSAMHRYYDTFNLTGTKYHDLVNRPDISQPFSSRNRFAVPNLEPHLAPWNTGLESTYTTDGVGVLVDVDYGRNNLVVGGRYDWLSIDSSVPDFVLTLPGSRAKDSDEGVSWSVSISRELMPGLRSYATYARQETVIYGIDGGIGLTVVPDAMNTVELREIGIKTSALEDTLFASVSAYRQTRLAFSAETTQVPATFSSGWEFEARWVLGSRASLSASATWQRSRYVPERSSTLMVSPSTFGLEGNYYGGRLQTTIPAGEQYSHRSGYPEVVMNVNATFLITQSLALDLHVSHQGEAYAGRLRNVVLPSATIAGVGLSFETRAANFRFIVNNAINELYFVPNSPDVTGELTAVPAPERSFRSTVTFKF